MPKIRTAVTTGRISTVVGNKSNIPKTITKRWTSKSPNFTQIDRVNNKVILIKVVEK